MKSLEIKGFSQPVTTFTSLLERNRAFAETDAWRDMPIPFLPRQQSFVITCLDPRVDPAAFLQLGLGDAIVLRDIGGRVTPSVIEEVAYISYLVETKAPEDAPWFELAVIHHTDCGSALLADERLRRDFIQRSGFDEAAWAARPVVQPTQTVRTDVERLLSAPALSPKIKVSGHVYDLETGLVTTIVPPKSG